jgi:hypothetical protein
LRIRIPDPGFDDLKLRKIYNWKFNFHFLDQKLQFTYPKASIKDAQATGEAFSPQNFGGGTVFVTWLYININLKGIVHSYKDLVKGQIWRDKENIQYLKK